MKVLMYGWEFPPKNTGGLGTACEGIVHGLAKNGVQVNLVLPDSDGIESEEAEIIQAGTVEMAPNIKKILFRTFFRAYDSEQTYRKRFGKKNFIKNYLSGNLLDDVRVYAEEAGGIAGEVEHDVIHAHDWMTYPAAMIAKKISGKPFVAHIHATEYDRSGDNPHPVIAQIEKLGLQYADKVIAVSQFTKNRIVEHFGIDPNKIVVIHNAVTKSFQKMQTARLNQQGKTVLFLGRVTMQKGPEYFLHAAKKVLSVEPGTKFVMAGDGDMMGRMLHLAHDLGIERHVLFAGFLRGHDVDRMFQSTDLFVMPSVSEPFGIAALEAIHNGTPVVISKQSGVSEVIPNMLKVDFWDIDEMANKIVMALRHDVLSQELLRMSKHDLEKLSWENSARKIKDLYASIA